MSQLLGPIFLFHGSVISDLHEIITILLPDRVIPLFVCPTPLLRLHRPFISAPDAKSFSGQSKVAVATSSTPQVVAPVPSLEIGVFWFCGRVTFPSLRSWFVEKTMRGLSRVWPNFCPLLGPFLRSRGYQASFFFLPTPDPHCDDFC